MMLSTGWNWQKVFSYGELVCFVSAWAVGLLIAWGSGGQAVDTRVATHSFSAPADHLPGIQATLNKPPAR